jgi:hypothetical protein
VDGELLGRKGHRAVVITADALLTHSDLCTLASVMHTGSWRSADVRHAQLRAPAGDHDAVLFHRLYPRCDTAPRRGPSEASLIGQKRLGWPR